jgi:hypothetical protein
MSRRKGQNPKLQIGRRNNGSQYFYIQYWLDVPGVEERKRRREILGPVKTKSGGLTKTEAEAKKMQFLAELNGRSFVAPSSKTLSDTLRWVARPVVQIDKKPQRGLANIRFESFSPRL